MSSRKVKGRWIKTRKPMITAVDLQKMLKTPDAVVIPSPTIQTAQTPIELNKQSQQINKNPQTKMDKLCGKDLRKRQKKIIEKIDRQLRGQTGGRISYI